MKTGKPKGGLGPMRHGGMKSQSAPAQEKAAVGGGASEIKLGAAPNLKGFGHKVPDMKSLTTDRGSFKIKG